MRIFYTSDTLLLTDVSFLETTGELTNFIDVTLINAINYVIFPTIIVGAIFIYLLHICYNNNLAFKTKKKNICVFIVSLCMLIVLFIPISRLDKFILNNVYNYKSIKDYTMTVSNTKYYSKYGVIGGMYGKLLETRRYEPIGYEEEEVDELLSNVKESPNKGKIGKPNVIVVFSESFWDVSKIDGIKFSQDVTPNYHALKEKGKVVEMITPSYGGISSNVEFEILTGGSLNYFSKGYIQTKELQINIFSEIVKLCEQYREKVISIHSLKSTSTVIEILRTYKRQKSNKYIFHWFTGSMPQLEKAIELGCYFSINPGMLKTKSGMEVIKAIPIDHVLLETDAPFALKVQHIDEIEKELKRTMSRISDVIGFDISDIINKNSKEVFCY